jgi:TM2 domain-containing membrane protein YozV
LQQSFTSAAMVHPGALRISPKRYSTAVILSAVFGFVGLQHFYLGRHGEGLLDLGLSVGWIYCFATGEFLLGGLLLAADCIHALIVTIALLTGNFRDGDGNVVAYPGQKIHTNKG